MNEVTDQKLSELIDYAGENGPGALYAALKVLRNSYLIGKHNEFAKHCCAFPQIDGATLSLGLIAAEKAPKPPRRTLH